MDEPVSDTVRGILDGHLVLSRSLAMRYHYPAIDVLSSVSRLENRITTAEHRQATGEIRRMLAEYHDAEDLINAGVYVAGSNPEIDRAIQKRPAILKMLQQQVEEKSTLQDTRERMMAILEGEDA
jgi:flagellum-specific ATP synthase